MTEKEENLLKEIIDYRDEEFDWQEGDILQLLNTFNNRQIVLTRDTNTHKINGFVGWWRLNVKDLAKAKERDFSFAYKDGRVNSGPHVHINFLRNTGDENNFIKLIKKFLKATENSFSISWFRDGKTFQGMKETHKKENRDRFLGILQGAVKEYGKRRQ